MKLSLLAEANALVKGLVAQGKYQNEEDGVVDGIPLLMGRENLRNEIHVAIKQLDRGESCDEETVFAEVDTVIDEIDASQQSKKIMLRLRYSEWSKEDLKEIARTIAKDKPIAARKWAAKLSEKC